jgi:hypothetical protein
MMPNGRPGDHPYTDIVTHGSEVFWPEIDSLVREIARLGAREDRDHVANLLWKVDQTGTAWRNLQNELIEICDRLRHSK